MKCDFVFRPLIEWPDAKTPRPKEALFSATYEQTLELFTRELVTLGCRKVIIQIDLAESDIRLDGLPRSNARPVFQGVIVSFESKYGPLKYATDTFRDWKDNLRAIALGLEALRKVDRYGITKRGEQYKGWKQLPAVVGDIADVHAAAEFMSRYSGVTPLDIIKCPEKRRTAYHLAAQRLHPDKGGSNELLNLLVKAKKLIEKDKSL